MLLLRKIIFILIIGLFCVHCSDGELDEISDTDRAAPPTIPVTTTITTTTTLQKYIQSVDIDTTTESVEPKLDIVFVWDTSGTMRDNTGPFGSAVNDFLSQLDPDYDFRVGVLVGHGALSPNVSDFASRTARLLKSPDGGEPYVLDSKTMSLEDIKSHITKKLEYINELTHNRYNAEAYANGGEALMFSLYHSVQGEFLIENQNHGFYRGDAALSVIFLSDENDICSRYPGHFPNHQFENKPNRDDTEEAEALRFCEGITTDNVLTTLKNFKGDQPLTISGLLSGNDNPGYRKLIADHGAGTVLTVEDNNYDELLPKITETIEDEVPSEVIIEISLDISPVSVEDMEVFLETSTGRQTMSFDYNETNNTVSVKVEENTVGTLHVQYYIL